jgi:hypothetical protein
MRNLLIGTALVLAMVGNAFAQEAPKGEKKSIPVAECGQMWKAHKASATYVDPGKGKRSEAWNTYRRENCSKDRKEASAN